MARSGCHVRLLSSRLVGAQRDGMPYNVVFNYVRKNWHPETWLRFNFDRNADDTVVSLHAIFPTCREAR